MNKLIQSTLSLIALLMCLHHILCPVFCRGYWLLTLLFLSSASYASSPPANDVHICQILDYEEIRARNSRYAATKQALNLNVGEPRTVRMIYFLPNDRPFRQEVVNSMKSVIRQVQTFFADQMEAHGHGRKTFRFETDAQGEPVVHRVDGQHPDSYYLDDTNYWTDIEKKFDTSVNNVLLAVVDISTDLIGLGGGRVVRGVASGGRYGGHATVPGGFHWKTVAHELGHTFGLGHDWRDGHYIMSYGAGRTGRWSLSACAAEFLSVHPCFDPDIPDEATPPPPTIELISSPAYPTGSTSVSIQLKVSGPVGLHQVILFNNLKGTGGRGVKMCKGLNGETEAIVQFEYDGVIPSSNDPYGTGTSLSNPLVHNIHVEAIGNDGNVGYRYLSGYFQKRCIVLTWESLIAYSHLKGVHMPQTSPYKIVLSDEEYATLSSRSRQYTLPYYQVIRAKMILLAAQGEPNDQIADRLDVPRKTVSRWRKRFCESRLAGLEDQPRSGRPSDFSPSGGGTGQSHSL